MTKALEHLSTLPYVPAIPAVEQPAHYSTMTRFAYDRIVAVNTYIPEVAADEHRTGVYFPEFQEAHPGATVTTAQVKCAAGYGRVQSFRAQMQRPEYEGEATNPPRSNEGIIFTTHVGWIASEGSVAALGVGKVAHPLETDQW